VTDGTGAARPPHVQVVRGTPDDVELAALVAGLVAASAHHDDEDPAHDGAASAAWTDRARTLPGAAAAWRPGADAWRTSLR
jgi:hypothetical protein